MFGRIVNSLLAVLRIRPLQHRLFGSRPAVIVGRPGRNQPGNGRGAAGAAKASAVERLARVLGKTPPRGSHGGSPFYRTGGLLLPGQHQHLLGRMVARSMATCRSLSVVERMALGRASLLPSVVAALQQDAQARRAARPKQSALLVGGLLQGEFQTSSAREAADQLGAVGLHSAARMADLRRLCLRLSREGLDVDIAFIDGKVAIRADEALIREQLVVLMQEYVPWAQSWSVSPEPSAGPAAAAAGTAVFQDAMPLDAASAPSTMSSFSELSLREQFSHCSPDELEAFTVWSR